MTRFITTIQLHDAGEADYRKLQTELKKKSFKEVKKHAIKNDGILTRRDEYYQEGNISIQDVTDSVLKAAAATGRKYSFTIMKNKN
jgi:hypothetical protein